MIHSAVNNILLIVLVTAIGSLSHAQSKLLDLSVLSPESQEIIFQKWSNFKSGDFDKAQLDELIRFLVVQEQFDYAQIQQDQNRYFLSVGKAKRINSISITGNQSVSETELYRELGVAEKTIFNQDLLIDGAERVRKLYIEKGFPNAILDIEFTRVSPAEIGIGIEIKEGVQTKINSIQVISENKKTEKDLTRLFKRFSGKPLNGQAILDLKTKAKEYFSDHKMFRADITGPSIKISTDEAKGDLFFKIERPEKYRIEYKGLDNQWRYSLENAIELDSFFSTNPSIGAELANRIKAHYTKNGFARVEVTAEEKEISAFERSITFIVSEGPRVRIKKIEVNGKLSSSNDYYAKFIESHSTALIEDGFYNRDDLEVGIKNLIAERQNSGFLRAKVISTRTTYTSKRDSVNILINMDEGPQTLLEGISFSGLKSFSEQQILAILKLEPQKTLRLNQLEESLSLLKAFYTSRGYLEMKITNEQQELVRYNEDSTRAQVHIEVAEGPQIVVGSIAIEGTNLTKDYVILNELEFKTGEILTPRALDESISRLQRLGHFSTVEIKTLEENTPISERTIIIKVADREPGLFTLGFGANNERQFTVRGYVGVAYRNILGSGRGVSARIEGNYNLADVKYLERKVTLGYLEPYLFNTRLRGRLNLSRAISVSDFDTRTASEVNQTTYSVEYNITKNLLASYDIWSLATVRDFAIDPDNTSFSPTELNIATTGPNLEIDYRDHPFNPTRGTFSRISVEYSTPLIGSTESIKYLKSIGSITHYKAVGRSDWVWANSLRGGFLKNYSDTGGVPYDKKGLILGGQSSLRGFQPSEAFPNAYELGTDRFILTTEAKMYLVKSELRFPIYDNFGGAFFYDGGAVLIQGVDIEDPYRDAVGVAFRYSTPVGAVSLEWGYKLDRKKERGEIQFPFHFSIGTF